MRVQIRLLNKIVYIVFLLLRKLYSINTEYNTLADRPVVFLICFFILVDECFYLFSWLVGLGFLDFRFGFLFRDSFINQVYRADLCKYCVVLI